MTRQSAALSAATGIAILVLTALTIATGRPPARGVSAQSAEQTPVTRTNSADFSSTNRSETGTLYTVPTGKRLVIEVISGKVAAASGTKVRSTLVTRTGGTSMNTQLIWDLQSVEGTQQIYAFTHSVKLYADAGTRVDVNTIRSTLADSGGTTYAFSGYLVNSP